MITKINTIPRYINTARSYLSQSMISLVKTLIIRTFIGTGYSHLTPHPHYHHDYNILKLKLFPNSGAHLSIENPTIKIPCAVTGAGNGENCTIIAQQICLLI